LRKLTKRIIPDGACSDNFANAMMIKAKIGNERRVE